MHSQLRNLDSRTIERILQYFGFTLTHQRGSHQRWVKGSCKVSSVAGKKSFSRGTLGSMIRQSGHSEEEWVQALDKI